MVQTWIFFRGNSRQSPLIKSKCKLQRKRPAVLSKWILKLCSLIPARTKTDHLDCIVGFNETDFGGSNMEFASLNR
jgi:hypothetical protein